MNPAAAKAAIRFRYRAAATSGALVTGVVTATTEQDARLRLAEQQLLPTYLLAESKTVQAARSLNSADLGLGARILSDLLGAGMPMSHVLLTFQDLAPESWRAFLPQVHEQVRTGASLSSALDSSGRVPPLMIGMIRAGEMGSGLPKALRATADLYESKAAARAALLSALSYPVILAMACVGSLILLTTVVLPKFGALLSDLGQTLPPSTAALLVVSEATQRWGVPVLAATAIGVGIFWRWTQSEEGQKRWHELLLQMPVVGEVRHASASATICATAAALIETGVTVPAALSHAGLACGDSALATRVSEARTAIISGSRPSAALQATNALTPVCLRLIRAGEESGALAPMLAHAAQIERSRTTRLTQSASRLVEPTLVVTFGGLVAFVAAALLQAVYAVRPIS